MCFWGIDPWSDAEEVILTNAQYPTLGIQNTQTFVVYLLPADTMISKG